MTSQPNAVKQYFNYYAAYWTLEDKKCRTAQMVQICERVGCGLDLVPQNLWEVFQRQQPPIKMNCVLPGSGETKSPWNTPFFPSLAKAPQRAAVQQKVIQSMTDASTIEVPQVIIFAGKSTGASRDYQFGRIVSGLTEGDDQDPSMVDFADAYGMIMVAEALNTKGKGWYGHPGYLCTDPRELLDKVIRPVGSPRVKLALDFYHTDMEELDPVEVLRTCAEDTACLHVAGRIGKPTDDNPNNRGPLDGDDQQIDYAGLMSAASRVLPRETPVLIEYKFPASMPEGEAAVNDIAESLSAAIEICESQTTVPGP